LSARPADFFLRPRSPLIFRSGKPFGTTGGGDGFGFPPPGTIAGALRAELADAFDLALDAPADHASLRTRLECRGPLLARETGGRVDVFFPCPADAVYLVAPDGTKRLVRAKPTDIQEASEGCDLPGKLLPVLLQADENDKREEKPVFWSTTGMTAWLTGGLGPGFEETVLPPPEDTRTHVAIDPESLAHDEGRLFQSTGLDFEPRQVEHLNDKCREKQYRDAGHYFAPERWGLLARLQDSDDSTDLRKHLNQRGRRLGADGRSVRMAARSGIWPEIPKEVDTALKNLGPGDRFCLVLATPAIFSGGWRPGGLIETTENHKTIFRGTLPGLDSVDIKLLAAAVGRWVAYSGWDMEPQPRGSRTMFGRPRAVRRLAPAGSVYWFELVNDPPADLGKLWLAPVSDDPQDRRDGFGLALIGLG